MNTHHPLQSLINLIEFDGTIIKKEQALAAVKKHIAHLELLLKQLLGEHAIVEQKVHQAQKMVHEHELEMKTLDGKEQEKKKQLEQTDSQKVYDALKKEITMLKKNQYDHEKKLVQSWKELESAQKELQERTEQFNKKQEQLTQELTTKKTETGTLEKELEELYAIHKEKEKSVPQEWLEKYNVMRMRTTNPIVRLEYDSCGGCFAQLPPQALLDLKKKGLIQCTSCYRFVYEPEETEPA